MSKDWQTLYKEEQVEVEHLRAIASDYANENILLERKVKRLQAEIRVLKRTVEASHDAAEKLSLKYDSVEKRALSLEEALERIKETQ